MTGRVLIYVVDDELLLAQIIEAVLQREGFAVKRFCDPSAALEAFLQEPDQPALLVTDFVMAPMNGLELIERLRAAHPPLRSLVVSGNVAEECLAEAPVRPDGFLAKPFLPRKLVEKVKSILEAPR